MFFDPSHPGRPMQWWRGASGRWYVHSICPIDRIIHFTPSNYMFVRRLNDGTSEPVHIGQSGESDERLELHEKLGPAIRLGTV